MENLTLSAVNCRCLPLGGNMLDDKSRVILFWFTVGMMVIVVIVALITLFRAWGGPLAQDSAITVAPAEVSLCLGEQHRFTAAPVSEDEGDVEVEWRTSGGTISEDGLFTADGEAGDYVVTAIRKNPRRIADGVVHVTACTPTPTSTSTPMVTPTFTPQPTPTGTPTPVPTPTPVDPRGDVGTYDDGAGVDGVAASIDIRDASVSPNLAINLQSAAGASEELAGWVAAGEALLWIELHGPVPDPPPYTDWLFALDLDGDTATGRPVGSARINPDLGDEAVVGVLYNPADGEYAPYFLVWDATQSAWADGPEVVRFTLDESRTVLGLALPLDVLTQTVAQIAGVEFAPEAAKGRAAVLSFAGEQTVVDFYPNRPQ
jgi:hypothetical protein